MRLPLLRSNHGMKNMRRRGKALYRFGIMQHMCLLPMVIGIFGIEDSNKESGSENEVSTPYLVAIKIMIMK